MPLLSERSCVYKQVIGNCTDTTNEHKQKNNFITNLARFDNYAICIFAFSFIYAV